MRKFILIPYGKEIDFYQRSTDLWRAKIPNSLDWTIITYRLASELAGDTFTFDGSELLIAEHPSISHAIKSDIHRFSITGQWSGLELLHFLYRRIMVSRFLLDCFQEDLIAYFVTSTSIVNLNLLNSIEFPERARCYVAGQFLRTTLDTKQLWFPSGSGFITNRHGVSLFAKQTHLIPIYDDVWTGMILQGFGRIRFPRLDIIHPAPNATSTLDQYIRRIESAFSSGIWHIRVKLRDNRVADRSLSEQLSILSAGHKLAEEIAISSICSRILFSEVPS